MRDTIVHKAAWKIMRFEAFEHYLAFKDLLALGYSDEVACGMQAAPVDMTRFGGNMLLDAGISLLHDLLVGAGGTAYNNASARLGVGDSATGEAQTQTALQAATNKFWRPMEATYPVFTGGSDKSTWRAVFASGEANYAWNEFTLVNAADDTGVNLNRKVSAQGTKTAGQTWTLDLEITWS